MNSAGAGILKRQKNRKVLRACALEELSQGEQRGCSRPTINNHHPQEAEKVKK